jgi:hypothetical protein
MADKDDEAAVERTARRIFELQNPGKPWPGDAGAAKSGSDRSVAEKPAGTKKA